MDPGHEVFPTLRVRENLEVVLLRNQRHWDAEVEALVDKWKCKELLKRFARDLSGGELRRLQILMAVFSRANAIFLDEPLTGLDDNGIDIFHGLMVDILKTDIIVVITEHHVDPLRDLDMERLELLEPSQNSL